MLNDRTASSVTPVDGSQQTRETTSATAVPQNPNGEDQNRKDYSDNSESARRRGEDGDRRGKKTQIAGHAAPPARPRRAEGAPQRCDEEPLRRRDAGETLSLEVAGSSRQGSAATDSSTGGADSRHADVLPGFDPPPPSVDAAKPERLMQSERDRLAIANGTHPATRMPLADDGRTCGDCRFLRAKHAGAGKWWKCGTPDPRSKNHRGDGRDITKRWPACIAFQPKDGEQP